MPRFPSPRGMGFAWCDSTAGLCSLLRIVLTAARDCGGPLPLATHMGPSSARPIPGGHCHCIAGCMNGVLDLAAPAEVPMGTLAFQKGRRNGLSNRLGLAMLRGSKQCFTGRRHLTGNRRLENRSSSRRRMGVGKSASDVGRWAGVRPCTADPFDLTSLLEHQRAVLREHGKFNKHIKGAEEMFHKSSLVRWARSRLNGCHRRKSSMYLHPSCGSRRLD